MKIVRIDGGLGNQMFDYALLILLREKFGEEVLMDASRYKIYYCHNGFELGRIFNISAKQATFSQIWKYSYAVNSTFLAKLVNRLPKRKHEHVLLNVAKDYPWIIDEGKNGYYIGYWQNHIYFDEYRDVILKEFEFKLPLSQKNQDLMNVMQSSEKSVSIHIRRGDYLLDSKYQGICDIDYYKKAINIVRKKFGVGAEYYIFSNDIPWCKENIAPLADESQIVFVDWNHDEESYVDMRLMSACKINIIANSSFSWWAAYMNNRDNKVVIAPRKWINRQFEFKIQLNDWECL